MTETVHTDAINARGVGRTVRATAPYILAGGVALLFPLAGNDYWVMIATRAAIYWVLVSGLNLVVGFGGQLAIGYVALLTLGAYTATVLAVRTELGPFVGIVAAGIVGLVFGFIIGLPALRLRSFYFAMTTLGFATIVTQVAMAWQSVTGGGTGLPAPTMPELLDTRWGYYFFCLSIAAVCTWMTFNIAYSRFGRALMAIRDVDVAAEAMGISKPRLLSVIFLFSGALAAIAGALFATLQSYITPDAFTFDLSVLFFIAILIGGRGSILGPLLGTILLTVLPEFAAPLVAWSTFLYAVLLLLIVLAMPGGITEVLDFNSRRPLERHRTIIPNPTHLSGLLDHVISGSAIVLKGVVLSFGGVRAIDGLDLTIKPGQVHGLIGPNGSGKTTTLNVISGFYEPETGEVFLGGQKLLDGFSETRARMGIARTFQTPRLIGEASVLQNVMIGGHIAGRASFVETMLRLSRHRADEAVLARHARQALSCVGLENLAAIRTDRLQHSELRFIEIARALMVRPAFLLLDEPAAGLSIEEINHLGTLIKEISRQGTGVLLVEHHADLIFDICDHVTVLNQGRLLAAGTPAEIRAHEEVISAYLGG